MADKLIRRLEAKIDALLEKSGIDPADFEQEQARAQAERELTPQEQDAIDNAPATPATVPDAQRGPRVTPQNAPDVTPAVPRRAAGQTDASAAPWTGYDDASADEVVERLRGMNEADRTRALAYERKNKNRVSITRVNWNS